jgi:tetratricopeptide (TPR) repeat protein
MNRLRKLTIIASTLILACMCGSVLLLRRLDRVRSGATLEQFLYITSPKLVKHASLGYHGLLADIYWTRAVQYYGGNLQNGGGRYELLWPLLNITTQLDPHIIPAYQYGASFLTPKPPNGAGMTDKAIELIEYGIKHNPDDWHLYEDLGFVYYSNLKDYPKASEAFLRGSKRPNAHPFLAVLAAQAAQHGGELETARMLWTAIYQTSRDKYILVNAEAHLRALQADMDVTALEQVVETYRQRTGRSPASFAEMNATGLMREIPLDPLGNPYKLSSDGHVLLSKPDDLPFVAKGLPPGYVAPPIPKIPPAN